VQGHKGKLIKLLELTLELFHSNAFHILLARYSL
jgi:hypothetical protein